MALKDRVAKNVKALRLARGVSQQDLANKSGLTIRYISRLENSGQNLTLEVIEKLAHGLGCTPHDLIGGEGVAALDGSKDLLDQTIHFLQSLRSQM